MDTPTTTSITPSVTPMLTDLNADSASYQQGRYILTKVGSQPISFPVQWVAEILVVERSAILLLPFYGSLVLGVVHHQGKIIPLIKTPEGGMIQPSTPRPPAGLLKESLSVVRLNSIVQPLANVGLVVDQVIGSFAPEQLTDSPSTAFDLPIRPFQPDDIPPTVWQPRHWHSVRPD